MKKIEKLALILLTFTFIFSCSENNDDIENKEILTSKTWKRGLIDLNPSTNPKGKIRYYPVMNCEQDDILKFNSNSLIIKENENKCGEDTTQTVPYKIDRSNNEITINNQVYKIAEETENQIKYYTVIAGSTGIEFLIFLLQ